MLSFTYGSNWWKKTVPQVKKQSFKHAVYNDLQSLDCENNSDVLNLDMKLLKLSVNVICKSLTHLFNLSLNSKIIPGEWKLARITHIHKGTGDIHLETNYRPISVLSHIAKIFERRVHEQLVHYLEFRSLITPYQSAYLKKHSTVTCLHRVVDDMCESIDDGLVCGVFFFRYWQIFWHYKPWYIVAEIETLWHWW